MWSYSICDKGSITFYKNDNIIFQNNPYDNMLEVNINNSIKYISELIKKSDILINNYDKHLWSFDLTINFDDLSDKYNYYVW